MAEERPIEDGRTTSWLMKDGMDRERLLDIDEYLRPTRRMVFGLLALALITLGPWLGWWTLVPLVIAVMLFRVAEKRMPNSRRPELDIFIAWCASEVVMAASVQISGGITVPTTAWIVLPVVTLSYRFPLRGVIAGASFALFLMLGVAAFDVQAVIDYPPYLLAPVTLLIGTVLFSIALLNADQRVRREAVIDPLTGLLNRSALATRAAEFAQQSAVNGQPVGLVVADLDHFKRINDTLGHGTGDAVLKDFAYRLRKELRAFDLAYRIGGEEFLLLMPGADIEEATRFARRLRGVIEHGLIGGQKVTVSIGVCASVADEPFDYDRVFAVADAALYEAKRTGRNRVCVGDQGGTPNLPDAKSHPSVAAA